MWWKIYFWITVFLVSLSVLSVFDQPVRNPFVFVLLVLAYLVALVGLYAYSFKKHLFPINFWKYYFWVYFFLDVLYFALGFLPPAYLKQVEFLLVYQHYSWVDTLIDTATDIPLLYALYRLSKGEVYDPKVKKKSKKRTRFQWGMLQMALWGYSSILTIFFFILAFFPSGGGGDTVPSVNPFFLMLISPLFIFWLWIIIQFKQYKWNWWKTTLIANAIFYSGSMLFGTLFPQPLGPSGFDIISVLQLLILLVSFYVFGKEQFAQAQK